MSVSVSPDQKRPSLLLSNLHQFCYPDLTFAGGAGTTILARAKRLRRDYSPGAIHPTDHRNACATREAATSSVTSPRNFSARFHGLLRIHVCRDAIPLQGAIGTQRINLGSVEVPGRWHATHYFLPGM